MTEGNIKKRVTFFFLPGEDVTPCFVVVEVLAKEAVVLSFIEVSEGKFWLLELMLK